jgi:drug/metabolite transporter (DMT)-like permease
MNRVLALLASVLVSGVGLLLIIGLISGSLASITNLLLQLAFVTAGMALLVGVLNLLNVHLRRIVGRGRGLLYSFVLVVAFLATIGLYVLGEDSSRQRTVLLDMQIAVESALAALLVFSLVFGAYRLLRQRVTWGGVLFVIAVLIALIGSLPLPGIVFIAEFREWLLAVPVNAGARGLLIGIALATIVVTIRALSGSERAYRE